MSHTLSHSTRHLLALSTLILSTSMCYFQLPVSANLNSTIRIPAINVDTALNYGSHARLNEMAEQILHRPVLDIDYSYDLCALGHNSYIAGHSAPALKWQKKYPAVRVFEDLNLLKIGDTIDATRGSGYNCTYKVREVREFRSNKIKDKSYHFPTSVFQYLMDDDADGKSTLTMQTCDTEPGVIVVIKAEMIQD